MFSVFSGSPFDTLVDEATSELIPGASEDLVKNFEICDTIKGRAVQPAVVVKALKRRLLHYNPNVQLLSLKLCDCVVKNGGRVMARELAGREFVDCLLSIIASPSTNAMVRDLAMSLTEQWSYMFAQHRDLSFLPDQLAVFKREHPDLLFPSAPADLAIDTMQECEEAPEWGDSPHCLRCRSAFTITNRKHHCRACGGTFCGQCSARQKPIVRYGYSQPVRVCDACFFDEKPNTTNTSNGHVDDFNLAIQLSLREKELSQPYDEEAAIKAAIEASRQDNPVITTSTTTTTTNHGKVVSAVERENIHLFSKLAQSGAPLDDDMRRLAKEMRQVQLRIEQALLADPAMDRMERADLTRLKRVLEAVDIVDSIGSSNSNSASASNITTTTSHNDTNKDIKDLLGL